MKDVGGFGHFHHERGLARGEVIDESALTRMLKAGEIAGAGLDVYDIEPLPPEHPFRTLGNVVLTPHIGYVIDSAYKVMHETTVVNIQEWLADPAADKLTRQGGASLRALVQLSVEAHTSERKRLELDGEDLVIDRIQITPLGLVLHELATNAVKYGCWQDEGLLAIRWRKQGELVHLEWEEDWDTANGAEHDPGSQGGFGSTLMIGAGRQLGGEIERTFGPRGVTVSIAFPAHPQAPHG